MSSVLFEMNKEYVLKRLDLCTQEQQIFFKRIYPNGLTENNIEAKEMRKVRMYVCAKCERHLGYKGMTARVIRTPKGKVYLCQQCFNFLEEYKKLGHGIENEK